VASEPHNGNAPFLNGWRSLLPLGLRIHPLIGKRPVLPDWVNVASNDPAVLEVWEQQYANYNIGLVLGYVPEHDRTYFVIDLDLLPEGGNGGQSMDEWRIARGHEPAPSTLTQRTGGGGIQLFYYVVGNWHVPNKVGLLPGVDVRGVGGQVAAPPSIHPETGLVYAWINLDVIQPAPQWMIELVEVTPPGQKRKPEWIDHTVDGPPIPESKRNDTLNRIAWHCRGKGMSFHAILGYLYDVNEKRCQPPLGTDELETITKSACKREPDDEIGEPELDVKNLKVRDTDRFNSLDYAAIFWDKVIYVPELGWLAWDGLRWKLDHTQHKLYAGVLADQMLARVDRVDENIELLWKRIRRIENRPGRDATLKLAEDYMTRDVSELDSDPMLVNFQNGTLDLRTFILRSPDPGDLITRSCTVEYHRDARDPIWEEFLLSAIPDDDMRMTFQAFMGSCLTGITKDKAILLPFGETDTGKSTAVEPIYRVLGTTTEAGYAASWPAEAVERGRHGYVNLAELKNYARGARMIVIGELTRGAKFNDGFLKSFSGGDSVSARALYKGTYSYHPQAKLVMHTNFVPTSPDKATQNRLKMLPFIHRFEPRNEDVRNYLEYDPQAQIAIGAWLVNGNYLWQEKGLGGMPWLDEIMRAYDRDSNPVAAFVEDALEKTDVKEESLTTDEMYTTYVAHESASGEKPWGRRTFNRALEERGLERGRVPAYGGTMRWVGWTRRNGPAPYGV